MIMSIKQKNLINEIINGKISQIEIKSRTHYFYNDMINLENFRLKLVKNRQKALQRD